MHLDDISLFILGCYRQREKDMNLVAVIMLVIIIILAIRSMELWRFIGGSPLSVMANISTLCFYLQAGVF